MRRIFTLAIVTTTVVCLGFQTASAGLLGMPLNLRVAIEVINPDAVSAGPSPSCLRYTDDVFAGPVLLTGC